MKIYIRKKDIIKRYGTRAPTLDVTLTNKINDQIKLLVTLGIIYRVPRGPFYSDSFKYGKYSIFVSGPTLSIPEELVEIT